MNYMSPKKMVQLDAWIAENVMGLTRVKNIMEIVPGTFAAIGEKPHDIFIHKRLNSIQPFAPTKDPAQAMEVLKGVIQVSKKSVCQCACPEGFEVYHGGGDYAKTTQRAATIELAICLFVRRYWDIR